MILILSTASLEKESLSCLSSWTTCTLHGCQADVLTNRKLHIFSVISSHPQRKKPSPERENEKEIGRNMFVSCLLVDVKQYANLIKTLSFLLKSYKPKDNKAVPPMENEQNGGTVIANPVLICNRD